MDPLIRTNLFASGDRVLAAVSGGADSLALLHELASLRADLGIALVVTHVHHGMRAEEADADVAFLEELCSRLDVSLAIAYADVPRLAKEQRVSVEEAGRTARYNAFRTFTRQYGCNKVATGHHADDQVETVLFHLFRGTGLDGLRGIPERRPLYPAPEAPEVVRPLLHRWKHELEAYCAAHGLVPRHDYTNQDLQYQRNRLRYELLPLLESAAPNLKTNLTRLADQVTEEVEVLNEQARRLGEAALIPLPEVTQGIPVPHPHPPILLDRSALNAAHPAVVRRLLTLLLREQSAWQVELDASLLQRAIALTRGEGAPALDVPGAPLRMRLQGSRLLIESTRSTSPPQPEVLSPSGAWRSPSWGICLEFQETPLPENPRIPLHAAYWDADQLRLPLTLRAPGRGDRFRPLGAPGSRLLSDLLMDRKIPAVLRSHWPVVADQAGIIWIPGIATAHRVRITELTQRCLYARISRLCE